MVAEDPHLIPNKEQLHLYALALGLGAMQIGWSLCGNTQTAPILIKKFGWDIEEAKLWNTIISSSSILGLTIGTFAAGVVIKIGRRKTILLMNIFVILGTVATLWQNLWMIILGRTLCGFCGGILSVSMSKSLYETIP